MKLSSKKLVEVGRFWFQIWKKMKFENEFEKIKKENFFQNFTIVENIYTDCI